MVVVILSSYHGSYGLGVMVVAAVIVVVMVTVGVTGGGE